MRLKGLTENEARKLLQKYGRNEIIRYKKASPLMIFLSQFKSPITLLLIFAALASLCICIVSGESSGVLDFTLIITIVVISAVAGFIQDYKAEKAIEALRELAAPRAKVIRDNEIREIDARLLVPGDIVIVEAGDVVPADCEVLKARRLSVNEAILTGESTAVSKKRGDEIYLGTYVLNGECIARVTRTGMRTKMGEIAKQMQEIEESETLFQLELKDFTKKVSLGTIALILITFSLSVQKLGFLSALLLGITLAVAAIPEGLPALVTLTLALGARQMAKRNALVRRLPIIESIGSVDIICTDKTGTLTTNEMKVSRIYMNFREISEKTFRKIANEKVAKLLLFCSALCNNVKEIVKKGEKKLIGDQTELAINQFAGENGYDKFELEKQYKRVDEIPFTSERKAMSVLVKKGNEYFVFTKGAPEVVVRKCKYVMKGNKIKRLTKKEKEEILKANASLASRAFRVLAFAFRRCKKRPQASEIENNLVFLGLEALRDPPRAGVKDAISDCSRAGIRVMMLTGDNPNTALAIAREIGLKSKACLLGEEVEKISDSELWKLIRSGINIFARVSPFHKLRILELLQARGYRVAMTGDGVNDALALKKAHVGIAMGIRGSEVAKQASDLILLDDNFATIRNAVEEGRRIFANIRKFVNYLFTCNLAEVAIVFLATICFALKEPVLFPIQLLWINLLTDGLPAIALGLDPASKEIMNLPPRRKGEGIIDKKLASLILGIGVEIALVCMLAFYLSLSSGIEKARTILFTLLVFSEFVRIAAIKESERSSFFANKILLLSIAVSLFLQVLLIYSPLAPVFKVVPLNASEWVTLFLFLFLIFALNLGTTRLINSLFS